MVETETEMETSIPIQPGTQTQRMQPNTDFTPKLTSNRTKFGYAIGIARLGEFNRAVLSTPVIPGNKGWFILGTFAAFPIHPFTIPLIARHSLISKNSGFPFALLLLWVYSSIFLLLALLIFAYLKGIDGREVHRCKIGPLAKCAICAVSVSSAMLLRLYLGYEHELIVVPVNLTIYLLALFRFQYFIFLDFTLQDVLSAALMQCLVYPAMGNAYLFVALLLICGAVTWFQNFSSRVSVTDNDILYRAKT